MINNHAGAWDIEESSDSASSDTESFDDLLALPPEPRNGKPESQEFALTPDFELQRPQKPRESAAPKTPDLFNVTCYDVLHSTFTGETHEPGNTRAHLATRTADTSRPQPEGSLFRWIRFFPQRFASSKLHLDEVAHQTTVALLRRVQQDYEHQSPSSTTSSRGRQLQPNFTQQKPRRGGYSGKKRRRAPSYFFCMPYFSLEPLAAHQFSVTSNSHPMRTLVQTQYPSASPERDLQQAIRKMGYAKDRECFHVPQLWMLVIDSGKSFIAHLASS
ncbi:MAG: hypothetical protein Q9203_001688 [Teloschistes exilis]